MNIALKKRVERGKMMLLPGNLKKLALIGCMSNEDEMVGWHRQHNGREFEQTPGDSEGWVSLACCSPWGCNELDMT